MPADEAGRALAWGKTATKDDLARTRQKLGRDYFATDELAAARQDLRERGHPVTSRIGPP
jgi:hypothetical protein